MSALRCCYGCGAQSRRHSGLRFTGCAKTVSKEPGSKSAFGIAGRTATRDGSTRPRHPSVAGAEFRSARQGRGYVSVGGLSRLSAHLLRDRAADRGRSSDRRCASCRGPFRRARPSSTCRRSGTPSGRAPPLWISLPPTRLAPRAAVSSRLRKAACGSLWSDYGASGSLTAVVCVY